MIGINGRRLGKGYDLVTKKSASRDDKRYRSIGCGRVKVKSRGTGRCTRALLLSSCRHHVCARPPSD